MRPRAIVIDDDESCRKLLSMVLERKGFEVVSLSDPGSCPLYQDVECICPHEHACGDLLITDNRMPRMTGLEFVEHQNRRGCKGIVGSKLVISGTWMPSEIDKAEQLGCAVLRKPYNLNQLLDWVEERVKQIPPGRQLTRLDAFQ